MKTEIAVLSDLATQINLEHQKAGDAAKKAVQHALNAGDLLLKAKKTVDHGGWLDWIKDNCHLSERTAQGYMRLSRELPKLDDSKAQRVADLPLREALVLLSCKKPESISDEQSAFPDDEILKIYRDHCRGLEEMLGKDLIFETAFTKSWLNEYSALRQKLIMVSSRFKCLMDSKDIVLSELVGISDWFVEFMSIDEITKPNVIKWLCEGDFGEDFGDYVLQDETWPSFKKMS